MKPEDFVGEHKLSGVDYSEIIETNGETILFQLDGISYEAIEDPDDGMRSYLKGIEVTTKKIRNTFKPIKVIGEYKNESEEYSGECNLIVFKGKHNGKIILEIGVEDIDDYYPQCVLKFSPQNIY